MSGVDELVAFLRAALDRDEQVAREAARLAVAYAWADSPEGNVIDPKIADRYAYLAIGPGRRSLDNIGVHIARWDPARVLAEVQAKRRIMGLHAPIHGYDPNGPVCSTCGETGNPGDEIAIVRWPCPTIRALAQPYAGQPGWDPGWAA